MKEVPASEVEIKLLLDEIEQGKTIAITREEKIVAYIAPYERPSSNTREAIRGIRELQK
jgi:antitoxin (DNA-binding transcriptional repressor) of toxin-antitoxin stability system